MIEGDFGAVDIFNPSYGVGIIACLGIRVLDVCEKSDRADVAARIAIRFGIYTDQRKSLCAKPRLFRQLAPGGILNRLADFDEATRQSQETLERRIFPADHKHAENGIDNDTDGSEKRRSRRRHENSVYV